MNIFEVFKHSKGSRFRIPETDLFEEEFVEVYMVGNIRILHNDEGRDIPFTDAYLNSEYILETGVLVEE